MPTGVHKPVDYTFRYWSFIMEKQKKSPVVRAIDLGWGYTKLSRKGRVVESDMDYMAFPSLAPMHSGMGFDVPLFDQRDTVVVRVDGTSYEVGPDAADIDTNDASRNLNDQFIHTEQYKAVFLGALHYIGESEIDLLVVGLPLSNMRAAPKLKERMVGTHVLNAQETVVVKDALVLPQPFGGLSYCMSGQTGEEAFKNLDREANLVVDPGFLTFDFLFSHGRKIIETRSSAYNGGVSKILRALAESISNKFGIQYSNLGAIDRALRDSRMLKINGKEENLEEHIRNTRSILEGSVNYMKNIVGDGSDIDNVLLMGGGAAIYQRTLAAFYPQHTIRIVPEAQFANVMGFQLVGEQFLNRAKA
jgi:plasmid segregation protein ParM